MQLMFERGKAALFSAAGADSQGCSTAAPLNGTAGLGGGWQQSHSITHCDLVSFLSLSCPCGAGRHSLQQEVLRALPAAFVSLMFAKRNLMN